MYQFWHQIKPTNMFLRLLTPSFLCFIFFSMTNFGWITISSSHFTNETDRRAALFTIRDSIPGDPFHVFSSWNRSITFCDWQGVTCGRRHQKVTMLNLSSLQLVGSMSPHIGNLTFLRTIDLSNNSFCGAIPREVGRLVRLRYLLLSVNSFHDEFPTNSSSLSGIKVIDVIGDNLGGRIPEELGSLSTLSRLLLATNHFVGTIPPSLGNLSALRVLSLMENNLGGSIPSQLGQLSKLGSLMLSSINVHVWDRARFALQYLIPRGVVHQCKPIAWKTPGGFGLDSSKSTELLCWSEPIWWAYSLIISQCFRTRGNRY